MLTRTSSVILLAAAFLALGRLSERPWTRLWRQVEAENLHGALSITDRAGDTLSVRALIAAVRTDPDAGVREHAATALGALGDSRACVPLGEVLLRDPDPRVREHAAEALGALGHEWGRDPLLLAMLNDPEARVRRHAAEALAMVGG